jgi:alpha-mannosidase
LSACVHLSLNFLRATYEIPYGQIERPTNGEEEPGQSWVDLSGVARGVEIPYGVSILNDGKYSFDISGRTMRLTVLRS